MKKKFLLPIFLTLIVLSCEKTDPAVPEPNLKIESSVTSIVESSRYEGQPGDVIEFTVKASAPAGLKSFYIELEQRTGGGISNHQLVIFDAGSPEVSNNSIEFTFSRELTADDFSQTDNFIRAVIVDNQDRKAIKGFRLIKI